MTQKLDLIAQGVALYRKRGYVSLPLLQKHLGIGKVMARQVQKLVIQRITEEERG